jgi:predicted small metal-binding protein
MDINRNKGAVRLFLPEESYDTAAATSEEELLDIAVQYAVEAHGHRDTPALREELRSMLRQQRKRHAA